MCAHGWRTQVGTGLRTSSRCRVAWVLALVAPALVSAGRSARARVLALLEAGRGVEAAAISVVSTSLYPGHRRLRLGHRDSRPTWPCRTPARPTTTITSDAGLCDRSYGVCQCFSGYEGSSCRTECPNDCSNPGTRMTNTLFATDAGVRYSWAWDNGKHYGCKCDTGFRGADFSFKEWLPIVYGPRSARRARIR